jgi:tetratricopeptide (TPR) repeat protein
VRYALRALAIDSTLAETHALLGQYHTQLDYNWPEVEREMSRALALNSESPIVRLRYAFNALMPQGRLDEAVTQIDRALDRDPLSVFIRTHLAVVLLLWRRFDRASAEARRVLEVDRRAFIARLVLGSCFREQRRFDEAIAAHRQAVGLSGDSAMTLGWLGHSLAVAGNHDEARAVLDRLHAMAARTYIPPTSIALIHLALDELDRAFEWMNRAIDAHDQQMMPIKSYAFLDPIRSDPRFGQLLGRMNLDRP